MELVLPFVVILLSLVYGGLMGLYGRGWRNLPEWTLPNDFRPALPVTVIIPARNEAANIGPCLEAILLGTYPRELLEIIVVDDHSDDNTAQVVRGFGSRYAQVRLLALADFIHPGEKMDAYKKKALEVGIAHSRAAIIVTTDADCQPGLDWLALIASVFQTQLQVQLLTAPVVFHREKTFFQRFQALDFLGLMGITGAGIHYRFQRMGNGANLAYRKEVFSAVNGYAGNYGQASGDDMFLIQQVAARYPGGIFFLKNKAATVYTQAEPELRSFLQQRLRWGTKNAALPEWPIRLALGAVFLFCWSILLCLGALPFSPGVWPLLVFQLA
ncbi:MAG: glycosyltransferase, partial [Saprospiraceae bacterium]